MFKSKWTKKRVRKWDFQQWKKSNIHFMPLVF
jgi:hypothetical protein